MKELKVTFKDGSSQVFTKDSLSYFIIDEKTRIIYVIYEKSIVRIPFESIKLVEETRGNGENGRS